jgi:hypothetical protein
MGMLRKRIALLAQQLEALCGREELPGGGWADARNFMDMPVVQ